MMNFSKRFLTCLMAAAAFTLTASAFTKTNTYTEGQFTDVPSEQWYASEVKSTYELGLMQGVGGGLFQPDGNVTVAEAITMAARASSINAGETIDTSAGGEWYTPYVDYAVSKGFVASGQFDDYDRPAKRYEVAMLFENAMPDGYYTAINDVEAIPDVYETLPYSEDLLTLYNAGIVMGSDSYGNFRPEDNITRAEAAAIINRVALPENRLEKTLDVISDDDAYLLVTTPTFNATKEGINSGWLLDNRGAYPRTSLTGSYGALLDISTEAGTAYIREINKTTTGAITLQTKVSVGGYDGVYLEFQNDTGDSVYRLETVDGDWKLLGADGSYTGIYDIADERSFNFRIIVDLDNNRSTTYINNVDCGTYPLATSGEKTNILNFRFATTKESTSVLSPGPVYMTVNYALNEDFSYGDMSKAPIGWSKDEGVTNNDGSLKLPYRKSASAYFSPVSGKAVAETIFILPQSESISYSLKSGAKNIVTFTTDEKNFYANGQTVYEDYYGNMWYRLRIEADMEAQTALIKINGREVGEVPFAEAATSADNIVVANTSETTPSFDDFKVFRVYDRDDYVPEPVVPAGEDKYTVGMNVCSLWQNGNHFGWACVSPYDDPIPVLGYYDEGNSETADWEIKYIVEHGIDFQAFCIYANSTNGPQRYSATHLYDGFMNAKYSDMTKFCVIWETANASSPDSFDSWKNYYVPYFIENYFKDPRHITIDNKLVICVFGADKIPERMNGTNADVKKCFDYLEEEVKKLGFDGMIYLACGSSSSDLAEMGFDGCYAYNWGTSGYQLEVNKSSNLSSANNPAVYTVPTISVGFNSIPWHDVRYPMMTMEDYAAAQEWVKTEYLPTYAKEDWQQNFVMLSTWNEYGEGTYILPTTDEKGFGYLDVLREAYTDEKADASLNTIPDEEQRARINRLYPQYRHLLRDEGWYTEEIDMDSLSPVWSIDYGEKNSALNIWSVENWVQNEEGLSGTSGADAILQLNDIGTEIDLDRVRAVRITAKIPKGQSIHLYFTTLTNTAWAEDKGMSIVSTTDEMTEYIFNTSGLKTWTGTLVGFRIDPVGPAGINFTVKSAELLASSKKAVKKMTINGQTFDTQFPTQTSATGDILVAFDPAAAMDFRLNAFHLWDKDAGKLTLNFVNHVVEYTVGSSKYTLDGTEKDLGYELGELDGLPLIPIEKLCAEVGYTCTVNDEGVVVIDTDQKHFFDQINSRVLGDWEFNTLGDIEGWSSTFMSLMSYDGYMSCESMTTSNDPTIMSATELNMPAEKYEKLEYRVRYKYHGTENIQQLTMYFITDKDPTWNEAKTLKINLNSLDSNGEWEEFTFNTADQPLWKDTITRLRFDPFNAYGTIDIDYIRFVEDPDYVYVDPDDVPFVLLNGDAEDTANPGFKGHADHGIVTDPEDENNHCYKITGLSDKKEWLYAIQSVRFTPGATYKVEGDVKIFSNGLNTDLPDDFSATFLANMRYNDPAGTSDHLVHRVPITIGDGWKHFEFEFTVSADSRDRSQDEFTFYTDPVNELSVGYYFDNIVVTETKPEE